MKNLEVAIYIYISFHHQTFPIFIALKKVYDALDKQLQSVDKFSRGFILENFPTNLVSCEILYYIIFGNGNRE